MTSTRHHCNHDTAFLLLSRQRLLMLLLMTCVCCRLNYIVDAWTAGSSRSLRRNAMSQKTRTTHVLSMTTTTTRRKQRAPHVVVAGGGFGGMTLSSELQSKLPNAKVTIVEPQERFCFLPLLYEYVGGYADLDEVAPTYKYLLSGGSSFQNVEMVKGSAVQVDSEAQILKIQCHNGAEEKELKYDALVVSAGLPPRLKANNATGVLQIPSRAFSFATLNDAVRLKRRLGALTDGSRIVVVGGGYVGTELSCTLRQVVPKSTQITLFHRDATGVCTGAETFNREMARKRLESLSINLKLGTTVCNVIERDNGIEEILYNDESGGGGLIEADLLIWTIAGSTKEPRKQIKGLPVNDRGRVLVSSTCQVEGMRNIYAIGDGAAVDDKTGVPMSLPSTAQVAMQQARVAASNVEIDLQQKEAKKEEFTYSSLGEMLSLGGDEDASISSLSGLLQFDGPLASAARRLVYAARMPSPKQAVRSGATYVVGGVERRVVGALDRATDILQRFTGK